MAKNQTTAGVAEQTPDYLKALGQQGMDEITQNALSTSYLTITQDLSDCVANGLADAGVFFNTGTQEAYGNEVRVIPVAFKTVWDERDEGGKTVARYEPYGIQVQEQPVPPGKSGFPKKINPLTGNQVVETFAYALVLADHPEAGFLMHTAGLGSMKAYRRWNTMLHQMMVSQGVGIFARIWKLRADVKTSKTVNKPYYALDTITPEEWISQELAQQAVLPARDSATTLLLTAPVVADETVAE